MLTENLINRENLFLNRNRTMEISVKVNGELIDTKSINKKYHVYLHSLQKEKTDLCLNEEEHNNIKIEITNKMIDDLLLIQYGKMKNLIPSLEKVNTELSRVIHNLNQGENGHQLTKDLRKSLTNEMIINNVTDQLMSEITDNDSCLKTYYEQNKQHFSLGEAVEVRHILIKQMKENSEKETYDKVQHILHQLKAGDSFTELAKSFSDCSSSVRGGDLGFITRGMLDKTFEDEAFKLKENDISDIVETEYGFHIIQVLSRVKKYIPPFPSVKEKLKKFLNQSAKEEAIQNLLFHLRDQADIEYCRLPK